ncbi:hypothetical protein G6F16_002529 [Rhizopus arrhizus]|nr:hypothetical protein G6F23_000415 [Rhizopus arrhizus]KAG0767683.1 hypothetical protein G6F24_002570 [Rhizopus arrhizus]KAG0781185.1 hypothetical protein G6F22_009697 [Rhizopus arrhizus]KAG0795974.1 hypothetical protein G6F21_001689 [Rhizopus arrhizus]KAG0817429.1 hypothetical protein G6F20_002399 [Rhizopus arrhizus]
MSNIGFKYSSPIDSLNFDSIYENNIATETDNDLALWTNAQFRYDTKPTQTETKLPTGTDTEYMAYERLASYLNPELHQQTIEYTPIIRDENTTLYPRDLIKKQMYQQPLLPKLSLDDLAKSLTPPLSANNTVPAQKSNTSKPTVNKDKASIDEDKRKRNTAASARFRVKKKQKVQNMEKIVGEMTEKSEALQKRACELEQEIKWLRGLLIQKESNQN